MTTERIQALEEALRNIRELNATGVDENGHRWANSDLIEQEIVFALAASQPARPTAVEDAATQAVQRAIDRLRSLHPSAGRPAWDEIVAEEMVGALRALTVQDAALVVANAIDNDMQTFNKALASVETTLEMPMRHFFSQAILAYARQLSTNVEVQR